MTDTPAMKLAQHIMMVLADNTPHGPVEYQKCLKVIIGIIEKHQQPSVPISVIKDMFDKCCGSDDCTMLEYLIDGGWKAEEWK